MTSWKTRAMHETLIFCTQIYILNFKYQYSHDRVVLFKQNRKKASNLNDRVVKE